MISFIYSAAQDIFNLCMHSTFAFSLDSHPAFLGENVRNGYSQLSYGHNSSGGFNEKQMVMYNLATAFSTYIT